MGDLQFFLRQLKVNRWCTNLPCTTCGAHEFRCGLEQIGGARVITELGEFDSEEFYDHFNQILNVFKWLRHEWVLSDPTDLESIAGSPAYDYFCRQYLEHREIAERRNENQIREEARQAGFKKARILKASHDLPKAVARGDFRAVQGLLAKGANPDFDCDGSMNTARQTARLLGREAWLTQANQTDQSENLT